MGGNILGQRFVLVSFGESHGKCVGAILEGCPAGLPLSESDVQRELDLRRPGVSIVTTTRAEEDRVEILSGVFNGLTTGAPICLIIMNQDKDSKPYEKILKTPRPSHADFVARQKYGGFNDWRGGGRFSGRITASYVMGGSIAKKLLKTALNVDIVAYTREIGGIQAGPVTPEGAAQHRYSNEVRCPDPQAAAKMKEAILQAKAQGDSLGGIVECQATNLPVGLGDPVFSSLDSDLSRALFSIPAVKGVEFGAGFKAAKMMGSEHNDPLIVDKGVVKTRTNNAGGIVGGLSNGMPMLVSVAFKPPASIAKEQKTLDIETMSETNLVVPGRHDPCVVPRAVPVVESVVGLVLADHAILGGFLPPVLRGRP